MNRSRRSRRRIDTVADARPARRGLWARVAQLAGSVADRQPSGEASLAPQTFEALEARQLLFSLTIDPVSVDPLTGLGSAIAWFGVVNPYIRFTQDPGEAQTETVVEDFNRNEPGGVAPPPQGTFVPSGFTFSQSRIRFNYQLPANAPALPFTPLPLNSLRLFRIGDPAETNNAVRANIGERQYVDVVAALGAATAEIARYDVISMDLLGLDPSTTTVQLIRDGEVVRSLTGTELNAQGGPAGALGFRRFAFTAGGIRFDTVRFIRGEGVPPSIINFDNIEYAVISGQFGELIQSRLTSVAARITGPAGMSIEFRDLYDRPMRQTLGLGIPPGATFPITSVDPDDDGRPDFNDGIGRIIITNSDARSTLTMYGGTIGRGNPPQDADFVGLGGWARLQASALGLFDQFESFGFGYDIVVNPGAPPTVVGLPSGPGSVIVGSPWVRSPTNYVGDDPSLPVLGNFTRSNQGVFVNSASIGSIYISGIIHGVSRIQGSIDRFSTGLMLGSLQVDGDLGTLLSGSDAGLWVRDDGQFSHKTGAQLLVGRSMGQMHVAARSQMDVTVTGNLEAVSGVPGRDVFRYREIEFAQFPTTDFTNITIKDMIRNSLFSGGRLYVDPLTLATIGQQTLFGGNFFRNDTIMSAEFLASPTSAVEVRGQIGFVDPVNTTEDPADVYAFMADGTQQVTLRATAESFFGIGLDVYARIVDQDGRTLAAIEGVRRDLRATSELTFRPTQPGVYYLVISGRAGFEAPDTILNVGYTLLLSGLAPVTLGGIRTGAGLGSFNAGQSAVVSVLSGNVGSIRTGSGVVSGAGTEVVPPTFNPRSNAGFGDDSALGLVSINVLNGDVYNITGAGDIKSSIPGLSRITIGRNLWTLNTGLSNVVGRGPLQGDLRNTQIDVGGTIGSMDIRGAIGINQDVATTPRPADAPGSVVIRTGRNAALKGDIGFIRLGSHLGFNTLILETSANSTVGGLLVTQDNTTDTGLFTGIYGGGGLTGAQPIDLRLGPNSDLRFFDTPLLWVQGVPDARQFLLPGVPLSFVEESGARFSVTLNPGPNGGGSGDIRVLPAQGGQGQIVGRIVVSLADGASLSIISQLAPGQTQPNPRDLISIGRIIVTDSTAESNITIAGPIEIDVWRIDQTGGTAFNFISNTTPNGDIVVADMASINQVNIRGDLGRTQMPNGAPQLIGPFVGIARGQGGGGGGGGAAGGPIQLNGDNITGFWNGALFRPVNNANVQVGTASWLDDVGSPVDPFLNGLRARAGDIQNITVGGSVGDVIATGGVIVNLIANSDRITGPGRFDGIVGNIYANRINTVDIGDGLLGFTSSPFARASIVADDDINVVRGVLRGSNIEGLIVAANIAVNADPQTFPIDGINVIELPGGGSFVGAYIASTSLDNFWASIYAPDDGQFRGRIQSVTTTGAPAAPGQPALPGNFFRSEVTAGVIGTVNIRGAYDASRLQVAFNADLIEAGEFRNSTIGGGELERSLNQILSAGDLGILRTRGDAGDISDLQVTVQGGRVNQISANNIQRSNISANTTISTLRTVNSMRGSEVRSGSLPSVLIGRDLTASSIRVAGPIQLLIATNNIVNSDIQSTGPDGRIQTIRARSISGKILSTGPVDTIEATHGAIRAEIITLNSIRGLAGDVRLIRAAGDLDITGDIGGRLTELRAGGNIGNPNTRGLLVLRGDGDSILAPNGTLYLDLRSTAIIRQATFGSVPNVPGNSQVGRGSIVAYGRIERVDVTGDWGGSIISHSGGIGVVNIVNGSLLPGANVAAYSGDLLNLFITNGHLFGNVHADWNIFAIRLNGSADGVFGDIGINPALSSGVTTSDPNRNQLPPGVIASGAIQGPSITAGWNIGRIILPNGSIFETFIFAGRAIGTIDVSGDIRNDTQTVGPGTVIAAGSTINAIIASGTIADTVILAGVKSFGADGRPGGTGNNADTMRSGRITTIRAGANLTNVNVAAGMDPGPDGLINSGDELVVLGISFVRSVTAGGAVSNTRVFADSRTLEASPGIFLAGFDFPNLDVDLSTGASTGVQLTPGVVFNTTLDGVAVSILFNGPGRAFYDAAGRALNLVNTSLLSTLTIVARSGAQIGTLNNFRVVTNDDASMGAMVIDANLAGNSRVVVDAFSLGVTVTGSVANTTQLKFGMNVRGITIGPMLGGAIIAPFWAREIRITGDLGVAGQGADAASVRVLASALVAVGGSHSGLIDVGRDLAAFTAGSINAGLLRVGATLGSFTTGAINGTRVSVADSIGTVTINGDLINANIQAGADLGEDVAPGGTGFNADAVRAGAIGPVNIAGSLVRSSVTVGQLRGPDGFFGTDDDIVAAGISRLGNITIVGQAIGSNLQTEQYRISSAGVQGEVRVAGLPFQNQPNLQAASRLTEPTDIRVLELRTEQVGGVWMASFVFNQDINVSTVLPALSIAELRSGGLVSVPLIGGTDYFFLAYDVPTRTFTVSFSSTITSRPLVLGGPTPPLGGSVPAQQSPQPGPGVYRFSLDGSILRASQAAARLDGNNDGLVQPGEFFLGNRPVGDAGDRLTPVVFNVGNVVSNAILNFYGPVDLDLVLRDPGGSGNFPQVNVTQTIRGVIGDHPNISIGNFSPASDVDLYTITLQAGQILRLGRVEGAATAIQPTLFYLDGSDPLIQFGDTDESLSLPAELPTDTNPTFGAQWLIKRSGTFIIAVGNNFDFVGGTSVTNEPIEAGNTGDYRFTLTVFDDQNSGFAAGTASGSALQVPNAPAPSLFAGPGAAIQVGGFTFRLNVGPDGIQNTADDVVTGFNSDGSIASTRTNFNSLRTVINGSIGPQGHRGVPGDITPDVDIFALNNGALIPAGRQITVRVRLADLGANLGTLDINTFRDYTGLVQFGIFDITNATGIDDGVLVASPSDFGPISSTQRLIAQDGNVSYGYDANGDFFITFVTPGRIGGSPGQSAAYAIYLQGVFNTDYVIEVTQTDNATAAAPTPRRQNVFIETRGGSIDWLEAGGLTTQLSAYTAAVLGFSGTIGGQAIDQYILNRAVNVAQSIFSTAGLDVVFSTNPSAFEFQPFSRIFLTATNDPKTIVNQGNFGYSQRSDPNNAGRNDEGVVFLPSLAALGFIPSQSDADRLADSIAAALSRRVGELMGLRQTANDSFFSVPVDVMAANSPALGTGSTTYGISSSTRRLSSLFDSAVETDFFLGRQNAFALLSKFLNP